MVGSGDFGCGDDGDASAAYRRNAGSLIADEPRNITADSSFLASSGDWLGLAALAIASTRKGEGSEFLDKRWDSARSCSSCEASVGDCTIGVAAPLSVAAEGDPVSPHAVESDRLARLRVESERRSAYGAGGGGDLGSGVGGGRFVCCKALANDWEMAAGRGGRIC